MWKLSFIVFMSLESVFKLLQWTFIMMVHDLTEGKCNVYIENNALIQDIQQSVYT